jgi:hypothetical protein
VPKQASTSLCARRNKRTDMYALRAPRATRVRGAAVSQRLHNVAAYHWTHTDRGRAPGKAVVMPTRRAAAGERRAVARRRAGVGSLRVVASAEARTTRVIRSTQEVSQPLPLCGIPHSNARVLAALRPHTITRMCVWEPCHPLFRSRSLEARRAGRGWEAGSSISKHKIGS